MAIALHHSKAKGSAKAIVVGIANHDGDGGAFPSMRTLAKYGGCDVRNARKAVSRLVGLGEIRVELQAGDMKDPRTGQRLPDELQPNRYEFLIVCPPWCDRTKNHRDTRDRHERTLWKDPRAKAPGGTKAPGGPPGESAPLTIHSEPPPQGPASTTGHARPDGPPCHVCSQVQRRCQALQSKWLPDHRHPFTPRQEKP